MTPLPDWILDGFERSGLPAFEKFARDARAGQHTLATAPKAGPLKAALPDHEAPHASESEKDPVETLMALYEGLYTEHDALNGTALLLDDEVPALSAHVPQVMGLDQDGDRIRLDLAFEFLNVDAEGVERNRRQLVSFALILAQGDPFALGSTPADVHVHLKSGVLHLTYAYPGQVPPHPQRAALLRRAAAVTQLRGVARELRKLLPVASAPARAESTVPMNATGSAPSGVTASRLTPEQLQALDEQYRVKHSSGDVQVTELVSRYGLDVQASSPAWPQHLMISGDGEGSAGTAYIEFQYLLPELPGEDLVRCARECRAAILSVLPEAWRDAAEIEVDRRVSHKQLNIICGHHVDVLPGEEGCVALLREVAVRCADINLMGTLAAALYNQEGVQAGLAAAAINGDGQQAAPSSTSPAAADPDADHMRAFYRMYPDDGTGEQWADLIGLNADHATMMQVIPISLKLEPVGQDATRLTALLGFDELEQPAVQERICSMPQDDPVREIVEAFSREHLAPLGLAGTLLIDLSLDDTFLNLHFVSPGHPNRNDTFDKLFAAAAAFLDQHLLSAIQEALQTGTRAETGEVNTRQEDEDDSTVLQALESLILRVFYESDQEDAADGSWKAYLALKPEHAHRMEQLPVAVMLQPGQGYMILMVTLRFDELDDPATRQRLQAMRPGDPVRALIDAFSREHLAPLGLEGSLHIDISLEDALLKVHFVSPGEVARQEAPARLFEVLEACQQQLLVTGVQDLLRGAEDSTDEGTLVGPTALSAEFLKRAGFTRLDMRGDSFTETSWDGHNGQRGLGFLWLEPDEKTPYPVLAIRVATNLPEQNLQAVLTAAMQDHFMQFTLPPDLLPLTGQPWMAARTLTPALYVSRPGDGQAQVANVRSWPVFGAVTPELLRYMASTTFGQFQHLLQQAGLSIQPDYTFPGPTGRGDRHWLTPEHLQRLVGEEWTWTWHDSGQLICSSRDALENQREQPSRFPLLRKPRETREVRSNFYLRYAQEEPDGIPALVLRAHTEGGLGRHHMDALTRHHLKHVKPLSAGALLPVTVDKDGDLTVRQIVLCPQEPDPAHVQHLIRVAAMSLLLAAHEVMF